MVHDDLSAARDLAQAIDEVRPFAPVPGGVADMRAAYAVQERLADHLAQLPRWGAVCGYKIAANSPALMRALGLEEPLYARVFGRTLHRSPAKAGLARYGDLRVEPEIALVLATTPAADGSGHVTAEAVRAATERVLPAFELIDMRGATRETAPLTETVAQNISNVGAVLGGPGLSPSDFDPSAVTVTVTRNGAFSASAANAAPQDPFEGVAWLANQLAKRGIRLQPGEFVLCGTHTEMLPAAAGDLFHLDMPPLGSVQVEL